MPFDKQRFNIDIELNFLKTSDIRLLNHYSDIWSIKTEKDLDYWSQGYR